MNKHLILIFFYIIFFQCNYCLGETDLHNENLKNFEDKYTYQIMSYETKLQREPQNADLYYELGQNYYMKGNYVEALQVFDKAKVLYLDQGRHEELLKVEMASQNAHLRLILDEIRKILYEHSDKIDKIEIITREHSLKLNELLEKNGVENGVK